MEIKKEPEIKLITERSPEELEKIIEEHINYILFDEFVLLTSPMGILLVDKKHSQFTKTVRICIDYCKIFKDAETIAKYEEYLMEYYTQKSLQDESNK